MEMGLRELQKRTDSRKLLEVLRGVMVDADDYDPADEYAEMRSNAAKEAAALAETEHKARRYDEAMDAARDAMRIMEGN